jgi:molybdate transport system ATP-binding protein
LLELSRAGGRFIDLELQRVSLRLGGRAVLRDITWRIRPGQRWLLTGPNGAGKTQLLKLLAGDVWPTPGVGAVRRYRCGADIFDEPYGIKQEVAYLGPERQDRYEHYEWNDRVELVVATGLQRTDIPLAPLDAQTRKRVTRLLRALRIEPLARRRFLTLSYGERRLVLLARALAWKPKLLLLDELFNGLDTRNRERAAHCLAGLSRSALPWVLSTHRATDVPPLATHHCQLDRGRIKSRGRLRKRGPIRPEAEAPSRSSPRPQASAPGAAQPALITLRRANVWRGGALVLRDLSLEIRRHDCWLVHGPNGSGKSSFIQTLFGDLGVAHGGSLNRAGVEPGVPLQHFQRRVGLIAPELQAIHPRAPSALEVVASALAASIGLNEPARASERLRARRALRSVGALGLAGRAVRTLSYGQLRRILFARALMHAPDILLLDEPYAGLDARTRAVLRSRVEQAVGAGVSTVMTTHHRDEWPRLATHELELARGRVVYCGPVRR